MLLFFITLYSVSVHSQTGFVDMPSAGSSSFATYVSTPPTNSSGIPEIIYPLLSLPTKSKNVSFDFKIQYHPNNIANHHQATDVGLGWSLFGGGIISRIADGMAPDDAFTGPYTPYFEDDDEYFYDFSGNSGRFRIKRQANGTYKIWQSSQNTLKLSFVNTSPTGIYPTSFTIKDGNGITYYFEDVSYSPYYSAGNYYRSAFHLTKVYDLSGTVLATLEYQKIYPVNENPNRIFFTSTLKKVTASGIGSIEFGVSEDLTRDLTRNDLAQVNTATLKNFRGEIIRSCGLTYQLRYHQPRFPKSGSQPGKDEVRFLKKLEFLDSNGLAVEKFGFSYAFAPHPNNYWEDNFDDYGFTNGGIGSVSSPETGRNGVLTEITLPTGGYIAYDFKANVIQYQYKPNNMNFGNYSQNIYYVFEDFYYQDIDTDTLDPNVIANCGPSGCYREYGAGLRIEQIRYYDATGLLIPTKTITYDYKDVNAPQFNSGELFIEKVLPNIWRSPFYQARMYYKHVKVTVGSGNGYTRYYYYTPFDTMENGLLVQVPFNRPEPFEWKNFMLLKDGPLKRSVTYSEDDLPLEKDNYFYDTDNVPNVSSYYLMWNGSRYFGAYTNEVYHTYKVSEKYSYNPYSVIQETNCKKYSVKNFCVSKETTFLSENEYKETKYFYPQDLPNDPMSAALIEKNMLAAPMLIETNNNGNIKLSAQKIGFKSWNPESPTQGNSPSAILAPEIVEYSKGNESLQTRVKINKLDVETGNPLEIENELGIKTSYIWGYNNTLLLAKIENKAYSDILASDIQLLKQYSNSVTPSNATDTYIINKLRSMRGNFGPDILMTGYVHKPMVGVTKVMDTRGKVNSFSYDTFGRLLTTRDHEGNLLSENKYHYRTQN